MQSRGRIAKRGERGIFVWYPYPRVSFRFTLGWVDLPLRGAGGIQLLIINDCPGCGGGGYPVRRPFGPFVGAYRIRPSRRLRRVFIDDCIRAPGGRVRSGAYAIRPYEGPVGGIQLSTIDDYPGVSIPDPAGPRHRRPIIPHCQLGHGQSPPPLYFCAAPPRRGGGSGDRQDSFMSNHTLYTP